MNNITMNVLLRPKVSIDMFSVLCVSKITSFTFVSWLPKTEMRHSDLRAKIKFILQNIMWKKSIRLTAYGACLSTNSNIHTIKNQNEFPQQQKVNTWIGVSVSTFFDVKKSFMK